MWCAFVGALLLATGCLAAPDDTATDGEDVPGQNDGAGAAPDGGGEAGSCSVPDPSVTVAIESSTGHCYLELHSGAVDQAVTDCASLGGYLVAINDAGEQAFVVASFDVAAGETWIGLRRQDGGPWAWTDGEPVSWTSWGPGSPDRDVGEDCVELEVEQGCTSGCWHNQDCFDEVKKAICEIES